MINLIKKGQKVIINRDISSVDGMLYKESIVIIDEVCFPDKDFRVKDNVGKIWYINLSDIREVI